MSIDRDRTRLRCEAVRQRLTLSALVGRTVVLKRAGAGQQGLCPFHNEKTPSFTVNDVYGTYHCFGCGAHGDAIAWVMQTQELGFFPALERLEREHGLEAGEPDAAARQRLEEAARARRRMQADHAATFRDAAVRLWSFSRPVEAGTPVDRYLRGRALLPPREWFPHEAPRAWGPAGWPVDLRWLPSLRHRDFDLAAPAMLAAIRAPDGELMAVHRTWLEPDGAGGWRKLTPPEGGKGNVKKVLGTYVIWRGEEDGGPWAGSIRLGPIAERMCFGEGIETTLSGMQLGVCSGAAGVAARGLRHLEPPGLCGEALWLVDRDKTGTGLAACNAAAWRWREGRESTLQIPPEPAKDWNDALQLRARDGTSTASPQDGSAAEAQGEAGGA